MEPRLFQMHKTSGVNEVGSSSNSGFNSGLASVVASFFSFFDDLRSYGYAIAVVETFILYAFDLFDIFRSTSTAIARLYMNVTIVRINTPGPIIPAEARRISLIVNSIYSINRSLTMHEHFSLRNQESPEF